MHVHVYILCLLTCTCTCSTCVSVYLPSSPASPKAKRKQTPVRLPLSSVHCHCLFVWQVINILYVPEYRFAPVSCTLKNWTLYQSYQNISRTLIEAFLQAYTMAAAGDDEEESFQLESSVREHHVFMATLTPNIGQFLQVQAETDNHRDSYAVAK